MRVRAALAAAGCLLLAAAVAVTATGWAAPAPVVRIHVFAHSDAAPDQQAKRWVQAALLAYLARHEPDLGTAAGPEEALRRLARHREALRELAREVLRRAGLPYGADVRVGTAWFGPRRGPGGSWPAGRYPALVVRLGRGEGRNWFCVAFPATCLTPEVLASAPVDDAPPAVRALLAELRAGGGPPARPELRLALLDWLRAHLGHWRLALRAAR